jgi:hypothetical protein
MHQKSMEADGADRADRAGGEYKVSEAVKTVGTCQNSLGQNGTHLGLLLLHVGPNGDGFGCQAFMEHYNGEINQVSAVLTYFLRLFKSLVLNNKNLNVKNLDFSAKLL